MLVVLVTIYKSLIICYLLLHYGQVKSSVFSLKENVSLGWKLSLNHFKDYLTTTKKDKKNCTGQQDREIYEGFSFYNPGDEMKLVSVLEKFFEYCSQE